MRPCVYKRKACFAESLHSLQRSLQYQVRTSAAVWLRVELDRTNFYIWWFQVWPHSKTLSSTTKDKKKGKKDRGGLMEMSVTNHKLNTRKQLNRLIKVLKLTITFSVLLCARWQLNQHFSSLSSTGVLHAHYFK